MVMRDVKKVVLAYSGGLDTSVILRWLQTTYRCEVVTFTADLGQGEELEPARRKAEMLGIKQIYVDDLRETFVRDFVFPMFRANALYEGQYLLGTSIARPLIAQRQIEISEETGADAVAHGATGKGNDQVRFELAYYALKSQSARTSAARRRLALMPICCTAPRKAKSWRIRLKSRTRSCTSVLSVRRTRRITPPLFRSTSSVVTRWRSTAGGCRRLRYLRG
jgi:hypothetical protein